MSATAVFIPGPSSLAHFKGTRNGAFLKTIFTGRSVSMPSINDLVLRTSYGLQRNSTFANIRPFSPVMEWQDCKATIEVDVPCSVAYNLYSDREAIPRWMPFISSVKVLEDKPDLSRWSLKYEAFGRDLEFSWLARNMQPIPNQKIHWRSLEGVPNKGAVRFYPRGPSSCAMELTVSYEVPSILVPVSAALRPFVEGLLLRGLERFARVVKDYQADSTKTWLGKVCRGRQRLSGRLYQGLNHIFLF